MGWENEGEQSHEHSKDRGLKGFVFHGWWSILAYAGCFTIKNVDILWDLPSGKLT